MDWSDNPGQASFREEVRTLIQDRLPRRYREIVERDGAVGQITGGWQQDRKSELPDVRAAAEEWANALKEKGWIAPHWPKEYGGAGLTPLEQFVFNQEMALAGAPMVGGMGVSMIGPTLIVHGSDEQKAKHLPRILAAEVAWAEGYSEPGSGSDLASLQTRAVRDGDDYVINGQKIWTSGAHFADWLFTLVRTDPDAPKHRGISFLTLDIKTPGITIRPLIDMSWHHPFNEVFYEDVRVPAKDRIGEENRGWYVGATLLDYERSNIAGAVTTRRELDRLLAYLRTERGAEQSRLATSNTLRHEVTQRYIESDVQFQFSFRLVSMQNAGQIPNYEASVNKLFGSELSQATARTGTKVFGLYSHLWDEEDERTPLRGAFTHAYIRTIPATIGAGTSEIQRNIIATRGLGLPRG